MEVSPDIAEQIENTWTISRAFLSALKFVVLDSARDSKYFDNHLLAYLAQDYIQSVVSLSVLTHGGIHNTCRRELRFLLEMSIKLCYIQQSQPGSAVAVKLDIFKNTLESTNISMQKKIDLNLLPESVRAQFYSDVGRFYGETSQYVHLTQEQILERMSQVNAGRSSGFEAASDVERLNSLIGRGTALALVFLFHSIPQYVVGDWLVRKDGQCLNWFYSKSKYIAHMDEHFDDKHERQDKATEIKKARWAMVRF